MKAASKYVDVPVSVTSVPVRRINSRIQHFLPFSGCDDARVGVLVTLCSAPQKPGMDVADGYVTFVRHSQDMLRDKVNEEVYIERLFDVSKMPSPPHRTGGAFQNVAKQQGREG